MAYANTEDPTSNLWTKFTSEHGLDAPQLVYLALALLLGGVSIRAITNNQSKFPYVNPPKAMDLFSKACKKHFAENASNILAHARSLYPLQPFKMMTDAGEVIILPAQFANEIRNEAGLHFMQTVDKDFHASVPGFEPFAAGSNSDNVTQVITRKQLTKSLNKITEPLSVEANFATQLRFGSSTGIANPIQPLARYQTDELQNGRKFSLIPEILDIVARLSNRVFLGDQFCRDEAWLEITKTYTMSAFKVANELRLYPIWLRSFAHWTIPGCAMLRSQVARARTVIAPVLERRRAARQEALAAGTPVPTLNDALDWVEEETQGRPYDAGVFQLILSTAAVHTTTDLLSETILQLAGRPELMTQLRQEVVEVLTASGWKKPALFNLKLMDSVIKEAQRLKPMTIASMGRMATQDVKLPNGETLRKGQRCLVDTSQMRDADIYEKPDEFDAYRFERVRNDAAKQNQAHLVSTGLAHLGFGHGQHACPGRFFAANEIKVALCHLIMKYDWKLAPGYSPMPFEYGFSVGVDQSARVMVRRRTPEIDIDAI